jgi:4-hydroxy-tetrahydrodipicolinate reductase
MNRTLDLILVGGDGRMGQSIRTVAGSEPDIRIVARVLRGATEEVSGPPAFTGLAEALEAAPGAVVVDVSAPGATRGVIEALVREPRPLVEATTGLDEATRDALAGLARESAVVIAPNLSPGIALLRHALAGILAARGPVWEAAILDRHHRHKRDAPSGTARQLAGLWPPDRQPEIASFRHGEILGEHTVHLAGDEEELLLIHRATDRKVFARGALLAARFAAGASPGAYTMADVLGISREA